MIHVLVSLLLLLPSAVQKAVDPISLLDGVERINEVVIVEDVPYASGHARQVMDVAMPNSQDGPLPVVVVIHGGGWANGDKSDVRMFLEPLANGGCLAISPNYRMAPTHPAPAAIHDIKHLLRWLKLNADELGIDRDRVALMGFSAGGHLSAIVGMTSDTRVLDPPSSTKANRKDGQVKICCVASIGGPMDLTGTFPEIAEPLVRGWAGPPKGKGGPRSLYSPVRWVSRKDPPVMLIHGEADQVVPLDNISGMKLECDKKGVSCRIHLVDEGSHIPEYKSYVVPLAGFLDEHLDSSINTGLNRK